MQDVSARKQAESELARRAFTDALTGLANRNLVMDHLALALRQEMRTSRSVGVLYLDLDHFKDVNDVHGHDAGDRVLREMATRLSQVMRAADTPGRLGGDEFMVVCPQLSSDDELSFIADRLLTALSAPVHLPDATTIDVAVSIGITTGDRSSKPEELVRRADAAMYEAKRQGRHCWRRYTEALDRSAREHLAAESLLAEALRGDLFVMHYQPIQDLRSASTVGVEALVRIQHPERGLLGPDAFVDHLEQSDLADGIEAAIIALACREWTERPGRPQIGLSINVSGRLAASGHLSDTVFGAVGRFPLNMLTIEMTERVMVHAGATVTADIQRLANSGVHIAIDDFGTGYASLTYLQRFPVSVVKIDRSFVAGLGQNPRDDAIVRAVVTLGSSLDMTVVAEGVETEAQVESLRAAGCSHAQGFLFSRPMPKHALDRLIPPAP
jgi:diguanylate cyclase (GGDEF)-like protein